MAMAALAGCAGLDNVFHSPTECQQGWGGTEISCAPD